MATVQRWRVIGHQLLQMLLQVVVRVLVVVVLLLLMIVVGMVRTRQGTRSPWTSARVAVLSR